MSTFFEEKRTCAICGAENEYEYLSSTNTFGAPDLDTRPAEMQRSTMPVWVHECPNCGYVSDDVSDETSITADFLKMPEYLSCDGVIFSSELAARFYKSYKIKTFDHNLKDAFYAVLCAAWACDDGLDIGNAKHCRVLAMPLVDYLIKKDKNNQETYKLIKADMLRRAECFDDLIKEYAATRFSEDLFNKILAFQIERAKEHDSKCYRVSDV